MNRDRLAGRAVVANPEAKPGDATTCPNSLRKFLRHADSPRPNYQGRTDVSCSEKARDVVAAAPERYLARPGP